MNKQTEPLHVLFPGIKSPYLSPFLATSLTSSITLSSQVLSHFTNLWASIQLLVISRATNADHININFSQEPIHLISPLWIRLLPFPLLSPTLLRPLMTSRSTIPILLVKTLTPISAEKVFAADARAVEAAMGRSTASAAFSATIATATVLSRHSFET
jgi:hypothetical protein